MITSLINKYWQRSHWFCFSFIGPNDQDGYTCNASCYVGFSSKNITKPMIDNCKEIAQVRKNAALLSVCYLGYMSKHSFIGNTEISQDH